MRCAHLRTTCMRPNLNLSQNVTPLADPPVAGQDLTGPFLLTSSVRLHIHSHQFLSRSSLALVLVTCLIVCLDLSSQASLLRVCRAMNALLSTHITYTNTTHLKPGRHLLGIHDVTIVCLQQSCEQHDAEI